MEEYTEEFFTFMTRTSRGQEVEMAVVDEFDFENRHYAVAALVDGDTICGEGRYIYRLKMEGEEPVFEKIRNALDYQKIAGAYMEMEE